MKTFIIFWIAIATCLTIRPDLHAQDLTEERGLLVSSAWLEEHLEDTSLIILHYGMKTEFKKGHIPGARLIDIWDVLVTNKNGVRHELPETPKLQKALSSWGVNEQSTIILSYQDGNAIPMVSRLFLTLDYAGLGRQVSMLNGGFTAWKDEGRPVTESDADHQEGKIEISAMDELIISREEVLASLELQDVNIIDARTAERYNGTAEDDSGDRQGHIPGAVNIPYFEVNIEDSTHFFKPVQELQKLFEDHGIREGNKVITYCGTGIWASPIYFTSRLLGYQVRFYDGSFQEWEMDESSPID